MRFLYAVPPLLMAILCGLLAVSAFRDGDGMRGALALAGVAVTLYFAWAWVPRKTIGDDR